MKNNITKNAKILLLSDFLWNLGRTLPHAILTIFLLKEGVSVINIAFLQSVYMIFSMIFEFPSGLISDIISRKLVYLVSIVLIAIAYMLIYCFSNSLLFLTISYGLYGMSTAFKSGSLDAEITLEYKFSNIDIKNFSVFKSYIYSISGVIGGVIGSLLFQKIDSKIYIISSFIFILSFIVSLTFKTNLHINKVTNENNNSIVKEFKNSIHLITNEKNLKQLLIIYSSLMLFIQPFFQYWQVLYKESNINIVWFGIIYVIFQLCQLVGAYIYKKYTSINYKYLILAIPLIFLLNLIHEQWILLTMPLIVTIYYIYTQFIDVYMRDVSPNKYISTFFSLLGTIVNLVSITVLFFMSFLIDKIGVMNAYLIIFSIFVALTIYLLNKIEYK